MSKKHLLNAAVAAASLPVLAYAVPTPQAKAQAIQGAQQSLEAAQKVTQEAWDFTVAQLFEGGQNAPVTRTTGAAEGTRTRQGDKTWAYYGHTDPGNQAHNLGSFSYQHGAVSPEEADRKQLARLNHQWATAEAKAKELGVKLTTERRLVGIDAFNQGPLAGADFVERLKQCEKQPTEAEILLCARTFIWFDPKTGQPDAPGLGNNIPQIQADQERRIGEVLATLQIIRAEHNKR